jgi:DNA polymerase-3 subunit epsilon
MDINFLWPWKQTTIHPIVLRNREWFAEFNQDGPIESYEFTAFDTELTGLNPKVDQIVSIGAVKIRNLRIVAGDNFFCYVRPTRDLPKDSTIIHKITPDQIKDAPLLENVLPDFIDFCGPSLLVGHFVSLDMAFVNKAAKTALGGILNNPCVDSMRLAQAHQEFERRTRLGSYNPGPSFNLGYLSKYYDLPLFTEHDALEDAMQTAYLFIFLIKKLREAGYSTLKEFFSAGKIGPRMF